METGRGCVGQIMVASRMSQIGGLGSAPNRLLHNCISGACYASPSPLQFSLSTIKYSAKVCVASMGIVAWTSFLHHRKEVNDRGWSRAQRERLKKILKRKTQQQGLHMQVEFTSTSVQMRYLGINLVMYWCQNKDFTFLDSSLTIRGCLWCCIVDDDPYKQMPQFVASAWHHPSLEKPIPFYALFCLSSWATGLCEDLIKQNKGESRYSTRSNGTDKKCKGHRQDSNLRYI
ncbi:hypothetical protein J6590_023662 [Homalodisca vitripennis]|nr:hypothetical protein J6590_023662 [Homalodisca vitripennis]